MCQIKMVGSKINLYLRGKVKNHFSRRHQWNKLDLSLPDSDDLEVIEKLWSRFGYTLQYPRMIST